jgi:hypothetical protein
MKFAFAITGALASTDILEDTATLLSVAAIRDSIQLAAEENRVTSNKQLNEMTRAQDPRKAAELLQEFALNTVEAGQGLDEDTRKKLIAIRDILTNETYISLEQAHRHDQDLLDKHARAINECGQIHIRHLQQDVEGLEVQLVRDTEDAMYKCRGLPHHSYVLPGLLQESWDAGDEINQIVDEHNTVQGKDKSDTWRYNAVDKWGQYNPDEDPDASWALKAVRSGPNQHQIKRGVWKSGDWTNEGHRFWATWAGVNDPKYDSAEWAATGSCLAAHNDMFHRCDALDAFIRGLPMPNCVPPVGTTEMEVPQCEGGITGVDSDLFDWFTNMKENALFYQTQWQQLKKACDDARAYYKEVCLDECARKQRQFETAFCSYRQGLHATCREYQGCHVLNEQQYMDLIKTVLYNADSRKIDWKAIHKIECYINVLVSTETNEVRAKDLLNCEAGNLNTIETILTGFNETNYLSLIIPEINVSCWDLDVPQYIDFKECDMSSVAQHPCTEKWLDRYEGLIAPASCTACAPIPDEFQYHMEQEHNTVVSDDFGGGWYYVHEIGRSPTDTNDLTELAPGGYHLPKYVTGKLRWNEVLIERTSANWCDSWGLQSSYWAEAGGASMCVQSDDEHVYCMNNGHGDHSWRQQPVSHFTVNCGGENQPACDCWPKNKENVCWAWNRDDASGPTLDNKEAPGHVRILSMKDDGSVVKISFQGEEKQGTLKVGNYNSFMQDAEGCRAITPVKYRVYVRCLGCSTEETEFHTKDGAQFNGKMTVANMGTKTRSTFTYESWFKSPLAGKLPREIIGGATSGLTLQNVGAVPCLHEVGIGKMQGGHEEMGYQLHAGSTTKWGSICFQANTWYHVAVTKDLEGTVAVYVNGRDVTAEGHKLGDTSDDSTLSATIGGGFGDGGQLFNVRIWDYARTATELYQDAFVTRKSALSEPTANGLAHWWPLSQNIKDVITGVPLQGADVRYSPVWCADLEASGMRGC